MAEMTLKKFDIVFPLNCEAAKAPQIWLIELNRVESHIVANYFEFRKLIENWLDDESVKSAKMMAGWWQTIK